MGEGGHKNIGKSNFDPKIFSWVNYDQDDPRCILNYDQDDPRCILTCHRTARNQMKTKRSPKSQKSLNRE